MNVERSTADAKKISLSSHSVESSHVRHSRQFVSVLQVIWDLSKAYQPELLERVSAGEVLEADSNL